MSKVIKEPTIPQQECKKCGCVFETTKKDFYQSEFPNGQAACKCPFCGSEHIVNFKKKEA